MSGSQKQVPLSSFTLRACKSAMGGVFTQQSSVQYDVYSVFVCRRNNLAFAVARKQLSTNDEQVEFSGATSL